MERTMVQVHEVEAESEEEAMEILDGGYGGKEIDTFYYEPDSVLGHLNIETSESYIGHPDDDEELDKNLLSFIKK